MLWPSIALLSFVTLQRLAELVYARRNTVALLARGGRECASEHYPLMVAMHAAWLFGLWLLAIGRPVVLGWLLLFMLLQGLRLWVLATLKERWTTRIIILPYAPLVEGGPYRFLSHPNYAVVAGEIAVLPLCFGLPLYAVLFSLLNGIILAIRIRAENACLKQTVT
ncbi:isoprenylcysteine carboxyl methyltransferase family protein [Rhizobium sp. BR 314]|uniref:isoprenylcysteine carboxyl methyltransferase family protein n=1 Tax=Rhizobium sp. BR 314 TaxID=3040013 RepID=UPI0039BFE673